MNYTTRKGNISAVDNVSFDLARGESLGLVGESGCGKTSLALTLLKLLPDNAHIKSGQIFLNDIDIVPLTDEQMRKFRWQHVAMVFQAAMNSLDPVYRVGDQIIEAIEEHWKHYTPEQARRRVQGLFALVGLDATLMDRYPHEFSGGMRQRAVIAMALACDPDLIIADEPTTALDVIVQDQVLRELLRLQKQLDMSMIYISHDIAVIAEVSDRIGVMYAGRMAEMAASLDIFKRPLHPYTFALMSSFPSIQGERQELIALDGESPDLIIPAIRMSFSSPLPKCD